MTTSPPPLWRAVLTVARGDELTGGAFRVLLYCAEMPDADRAFMLRGWHAADVLAMKRDHVVVSVRQLVARGYLVRLGKARYRLALPLSSHCGQNPAMCAHPA